MGAAGGVVAKLENRVAIVTGAGRGVGRGIAERFGQEGAKVVVASRTEATVDEVAQRIQDVGGVALGVTVDVGDRAQVDQMVARVIDTFGRVDILVNNAQSFGTPGSPRLSASQIPLEDFPEDEWDHMFQTGVKASLYAMQAVFSGMKERGWGRIINFGSAAEIKGYPMLSGYNANKGAIRALSRTAALEWARFGITVNVMNPGVETDSVREYYQQMAGENAEAVEVVRAQVAAHNPMGRLGTPEDAGALATFICSDDAAYLTAMTFMLDGGATPT